MNFKPHPYQLYCIQRAITDQAVGLFLDMGLGKTVITLTAINDLRYNRFAVRKCLIIAPKKVAEATWTEERDQWDHLKLLRINLVLGSTQKRIRALNTPGDIWVINRENVSWLVDYYKTDWPFDMVVIDELSSFKASDAKRFKALKAIRPKINRVIGLTGTPAPNGYMDLWSQVYLLDRGERLHSTITAYRARYFDHDPYKHRYSLKPGAAEMIDGKLKDICISMSASDYLQLPDVVVNDIPVVLDKKARAAYDVFEERAVLEILAELERGAEEQGLDKESVTLSATSAAVLTNKLLQICGGAVYDENRKMVPVHSCKLDAFAELIEQMNGKPALVFYSYQHERDRILNVLASKFPQLRVRELKKPEDQMDWNDRKIDILLAHPASAGYGLNLQRGGNHVIWFGLNWSLELYQQANKRLHRQGQQEKVIIHRLLVKDSRDEDVARALEDKGDTQQALMDSLKARIDKWRCKGA